MNANRKPIVKNGVMSDSKKINLSELDNIQLISKNI